MVNDERVEVYAGAMSYDPTSGGHIQYDPLTVHRFVIIDHGMPGKPGFQERTVYTPTAVGALRITAATGTVLTLQSRQGYRFLFDVGSERMTPLGSPR